VKGKACEKRNAHKISGGEPQDNLGYNGVKVTIIIIKLC
jgi:hypothetical protein